MNGLSYGIETVLAVCELERFWKQGKGFAHSYDWMVLVFQMNKEIRK